MKLSSDLKSVELTVSGRYTAAELDQLMRTLAEMRATMLPSVPPTRDRLLQESGGSVLIEKDPSLAIAARRGGGFRLWVRNQGFGWLAYEIDNKTAIGMRDMVNKHTHGLEGVHLFSDSDGKKH